MKKLIWLFAILETLSIIAIGYFYWASLHTTYLLGHLIEGYKEMLIFSVVAWILNNFTHWLHCYTKIKKKNKDIEELYARKQELKNSFLGAVAEITILKNTNKDLQARCDMNAFEMVSLKKKWELVSEEKDEYISKLGDTIATLSLKLEELKPKTKKPKTKKK
jgi:hypothetical protein